ncbi:MAG: hypothetical protein Q4D98_05220, partial [Planctomycetia bacterium]|nr:hypothetical protein [Planctomycetia bacterium]
KIVSSQTLLQKTFRPLTSFAHIVYFVEKLRARFYGRKGESLGASSGTTLRFVLGSDWSKRPFLSILTAKI